MRRTWLLGVMVALGAAVPAHATFPGGNGRIAYTWSRGGEAFEAGPIPRLVGVVSVRPDGGDRRLVARGGTNPAYSPGGDRIAFLRSHRLWVAGANGTHARPVTPRGWLVGQQEWSPAGKRLAFVRGFDESVRTVLYTVKPDGSGLARIVKAPMPISLSEGAWSPDGKAIVYEQSPVVRVIRAGRLTTLARPASMPTWSSRGLIAYETRVPEGGRSQVCIRRRDPLSAVNCVSAADASIENPVWSPGGRRLLVTHIVGGDVEFWTVRPDGTVVTRAPAGGLTIPVFSPDGQFLVSSETRFAGEPRLQYTDLFVQRPDGSDRRRLVRGGQAQSPDWQPRR
jgi:Tol biopolymer transport system component